MEKSMLRKLGVLFCFYLKSLVVANLGKSISKLANRISRIKFKKFQSKYIEGENI